MEHIPKPSAASSHIEVPYLFDESCPYVYDNKKSGFGTYPERCGWEKSSLRDSGDITKGGSKTLKQVASFWQSWLYFGFMHLVFYTPIRISDFICLNSRGQQIVTTRCLPQYLIRWSELVSQISEQGRHGYITSLDRNIKSMGAYFAKCAEESSPLPAEVVLSIVILHRTIICFKLHLFPASRDINEWWAQKARVLLDSQMYANGWCKSEVFMLHQRLSSFGIYFSNLLGPRLRNRSHSSCSDKECTTLNIVEDLYKTQHARLGCNCQHLTVDSQTLSSIIRNESVPLIRYSREAEYGASQIEIVTYGRNTSFVAISHVWADGLGNTEGNSLPTCQLSLLKDQVDTLFKSQSLTIQQPLVEDKDHLFWIDTLCVPTQPERERCLAIASLRDIYRRANKVLVLNAELGKVSCNVSDQELSIRIASAPWWRRLWTLQEGALANELWFQFADGAVNAKSLLDKNHNVGSSPMSRDWNAANQISHEAVDCLWKLCLLKSEPPAETIRHIFEYVNWRSTSKRSDETICLGTLLNLDVTALIDTPQDQRMKAFILMQKRFPAISLFMPEHHVRIEDEGFRWAPKSFVFRRGGISAYQRKTIETISDREEPLGLADERLALADERGLHSEYFGFRIDLSRSPQDKTQLLFSDESDNSWYILNPAMGDSISWKDADPHKMLDPALVLPRPPSLDDRAFLGLLVSIYKEENDTLFARYLGTTVGVLIQKGGTEDEVRSSVNMSVLSDIRSARFKNMGLHQKWCIG
jgi:Heterokaryon incompatibility protein (HET)